MTPRDTLKAPRREQAPVETLPELLSQRKRPELGRYRLEVDRQMKRSFDAFEAAQSAGMAIKSKFPIVRVSIYDAVDGINTEVESATA
jgi:hypothetical protein